MFFVRWGAVGGIFALKFLVYSAKEYSLIKWAGKRFLRDLGEKDGEKRAYKNKVEKKREKVENSIKNAVHCSIYML